MFALHTVKSARNVYGYIRQALENGNTINYLTTSSTEDLTRNISKDWSGATSYISSRQLSIQSAYDYFPKNESKKAVASKAHSAQKLPSSQNLIVVLCPAAVSEYVELDLNKSRGHTEQSSTRVERIKKLETLVGNAFHDSVVVCCLLDRFVECLEIVPLLNLMKHHQLAIRSDGEIMPLSDEDILMAMKKGTDAALGEGSSTLIFKTIHRVYGLDETALLLRPEVWRDKLEKFLGGHNTYLIEKAITEEIIKLVTQRHQSASGSK